MNVRQTIMVIEDDAAIRRGLVDSLEFAGYRVVECADGGSAIDLICESSPDLILLDVLLPQRNGFDILDDLRKLRPEMPVIMVTARGGESDRVEGLRGGADDYIVKPFSPRELLARIEAVLRRTPQRVQDVPGVALDNLRIDFARREIIFKDAHRTQLSERETDVLRYLASNRGRIIDRDELLSRVWGLDPRGLSTRTIDMTIARLREKLNDHDDEHPFIITVRGKGYMLCDRIMITEPASD